MPVGAALLEERLVGPALAEASPGVFHVKQRQNSRTKERWASPSPDRAPCDEMTPFDSNPLFAAAFDTISDKNRRRSLQPQQPALFDTQVCQSHAVRRLLVFLDLIAGAPALERDHPATNHRQRSRPLSETVEWRNRTRGHYVGRCYGHPNTLLISAAAHNTNVAETELRNRFLQKRRSALQRLDQRHRDVGPGQGERDTRKTGPTPDVRHRSTRLDYFTDNSTVEYMADPELRELSWTDQSTDESLHGQQVRVPLRDFYSISEDSFRRLWSLLDLCIGSH